MKQKMMFLLLFVYCSSLFASVIQNNQTVVDASGKPDKAQKCRTEQIVAVWDSIPEQDAIRVIEDFYRVYGANILSEANMNDSLIMKKYVTDRLREKMDRVRTAIGADPIIRAQDFNGYALNSIKITPLGNDWYMVHYKWNVNDDNPRNIPLKVKDIDGHPFIDYITPEWNDSIYGDSLLGNNIEALPIDNSSPLSFVKTFYAAYTSEYCRMPENLISRLAALRAKCFTPNALKQFEKAEKEYESDGLFNYDLLIDDFDFDCLWIASISYTSLDDNTCRIRLKKRRNSPATLTIGLIKQAEGYKIDSIHIEK